MSETSVKTIREEMLKVITALNMSMTEASREDAASDEPNGVAHRLAIAQTRALVLLLLVADAYPTKVEAAARAFVEGVPWLRIAESEHWTIDHTRLHDALVGALAR